MKIDKAVWKQGMKFGAGATLALLVIHGTAQAVPNGGAAVALREGESWSDAREAALVADARAPAQATNATANSGGGASAGGAPGLAADLPLDEATLREDLAHAGQLGLCFHKGNWLTGTHVDGTIEEVPKSIAFTAEMRLEEKKGALYGRAVNLRDLQPEKLQPVVQSCLDFMLRTIPFPASSHATVVRARLRLEPVDEQVRALKLWLNEQPEPLLLDVSAAILAIKNRPENQVEQAGAGTLDERGAPSWGPAGAKVTLVEFTDYGCSYCKKVNDTLLSLRASYGDQVRFVFKQNPLPGHPLSVVAAEAVLAAAAQGRFDQYRALLYTGGGELLTRDALENDALLCDLDMGRFHADLDGHRYLAQVEADQAEAQRLNAHGVPTFFINGAPLEGAQPLETFAEKIDAALAHR